MRLPSGETIGRSPLLVISCAPASVASVITAMDMLSRIGFSGEGVLGPDEPKTCVMWPSPDVASKVGSVARPKCDGDVKEVCGIDGNGAGADHDSPADTSRSTADFPSAVTG